MIRRVLKGVGVVVLALVAVVVIGVATGRTAGQRTVPAGHVRNTARYLVMRDSVKIAIDLWLPAELQSGARVPTVVNSTRYVRASALGPLARWALRFTRGSDEEPDVAAFNSAGYAVVKVDARGSGASTGSRQIEWSPDEVEDYGEVVDWIVAQAWSNGRVGGYGVSYEGNTAEVLAATGREAVKAVAPLYDDFDPAVNIAYMGGVLNEYFISQWGKLNAMLDRSDSCGLAGMTGFACRMLPLVYGGTKPVDDDRGGRELKAILAARQNYDVLDALQRIPSPRDTFPGTTLTFRDVSPYGMKERIERFNTPMLVRIGWEDGGTMNVALGRFFTLRNPQQLELGPWSHGGGHHVDPFLPDSTPTDPPRDEQFRQMIAFFDRYLKVGGEAATPVHQIRYYTMNDGRWRTTSQWPPDGMRAVRWYLDTASSLGTVAPVGASGTDSYQVDTTASTGAGTTRWDTQLGGGDVVYPDRRDADRKLLTYTSAPLATDIEITGVPVVTLHVASTHTDGGFFGYLEDVAPDGRVTYITEGMLRALHRRESSEAPPYRHFGPYHTYTSRDTMPLVPGEVATLRFELFTTSVRLKAGHRLRLALAGADRPLLGLYPPNAAPTWTVHRSATHASFVEVPMMESRP
ncbi:MAG: CocE/NonD family hydrolase [Gemmatimonadetes bacterium]|nr:CocE/NonD family hydrolase [Gemmatimonadota bacterium]